MFFDVADILSTQLESNGAILCQLGDGATGEVVSVDAELYAPFGLASRPSKPSDDGRAAQALYIQTGSRDSVFVGRDLRSSTVYGSLGEGETALYANGPEGEGTGRVMLKDNGDAASISLVLQKDNDSSGLPVTLQLKSDGSLAIVVANFGAFTMGQAGVSLVSTDGVNSSAINMTPTEISLTSMKLNLAGQGILLGGSATNATAVLMSPMGTPVVGVAGTGTPSTSVFCSI